MTQRSQRHATRTRAHLLHGLALILCLGTSTGAVAAEAPLVVAHNMVNAWNRLDVDGIADLFAEDGRFQSMMQTEPLVGREAIRSHFGALLEGATALELQLRNIAENNGVVFLERVDVFSYKGREGSVPVVAVLEIRDGKVQAWREYYDRASLMREMGINEEEGAH